MDGGRVLGVFLMDWATWIPLLIAIAAWFPKILEWLGGRNDRLADAAKSIAEGGQAAVTSVQGLLADYDKIIDDLRAENHALAKRITQAEDGRAGRIQRIVELEEANEALGARISALNTKINKDIVETSVLRDEVEALRQQVAESEAKYARARAVIEKLVKAMKKAQIPLPDDVDLSDSITGFKWDKP